MLLNRYNIGFILLLLFHTIILLYLVNHFSISYKEAIIYFTGENKLLYGITHISTAIFGQNDFALRIPFILFYIASSVLLYILTADYFKTPLQRVVSVGIFMMLPGVNSAALLVNESIVVIFLTLVYLTIFKFKNRHCYLLLILFLFVDNSFSILFLGLFFYSLIKKENILLVLSLVLFGLSMSYFGFEIGGKPKSYLLDTFAIYGTIFSPLLFLYFMYAIYRIGLKHEKDILWVISATALGLSLIFSLRQNIKIEDFAPFVVIAIPLMVKLFSHSLRIRLKEFRRWHYYALRAALGVLLLSYLNFMFNKYLYLFLEEPKSHFAYKYHIAKDLANALQKEGINEVFVNDKELRLRLQFYGIENSKKYFVSSYKEDKYKKQFEISYFNKVIKTYYLYQ